MNYEEFFCLCFRKASSTGCDSNIDPDVCFETSYVDTEDHGGVETEVTHVSSLPISGLALNPELFMLRIFPHDLLVSGY